MLLVLALLFFNWRTTLTVTVAIALSFVVAALVLHLFDTTFNAVVLAGLVIAVGAVVYDAVSNVETITRRQRRKGADDRFELRRGERRARGVARDRPNRLVGNHHLRAGTPADLPHGRIVGRLVLPAAGRRMPDWRCWRRSSSP